MYYQIYCNLKGKIDSLSLKAGDMLPPEPELERIFEASRAPVRQALGMLEHEGLIVRVPGKGTFIAEQQEELRLWFNCSPFKRHFLKEWDKIRCRTLEIKEDIPPQKVQEFLLLGKSQKTTYIERIRYRGDEALIYTQHYLHPSFEIKKIRDAGDFLSFRSMLMENFALEITRIEDSLTAVSATAIVAKHLDVPIHTPLLLVSRRSFSGVIPIHIDVFYVLSEEWDYNVIYEEGPAGRLAISPS